MCACAAIVGPSANDASQRKTPLSFSLVCLFVRAFPRRTLITVRSISHLVSAVRVTSTSLRGVVHEGDIAAFESWRSIFVPPRRHGVRTLPSATEAMAGAQGEMEGLSDFRSGVGDSDDVNAAAAATAAAAVHLRSSRESGEDSRDAHGGEVGDEGQVGPLLLTFPAVLSPTLSVEAAFGALRIEVAGSEGGGDDDTDGDGRTSTKATGSSEGVGGGPEEEHEIGSPAVPAPSTSREGLGVDCYDADGDPAVGGQESCASRTAEAVPAGIPAEQDSEGDNTRAGRSRGVPRRESFLRRRLGAPSAVVEAKDIRVGVDAVVSVDDGDRAAGDDAGATKVGRE